MLKLAFDNTKLVGREMGLFGFVAGIGKQLYSLGAVIQYLDKIYHFDKIYHSNKIYPKQEIKILVSGIGGQLR